MENRKVERSFLIFTLKDFRDRYVGTLREDMGCMVSCFRELIGGWTLETFKQILDRATKHGQVPLRLYFDSPQEMTFLSNKVHILQQLFWYLDKTEIGRIDGYQLYATIVFALSESIEAQVDAILSIFSHDKSIIQKYEFAYFLDSLFRGLPKVLIVKPNIFPSFLQRRLAQSERERMLDRIFGKANNKNFEELFQGIERCKEFYSLNNDIGIPMRAALEKTKLQVAEAAVMRIFCRSFVLSKVKEVVTMGSFERQTYMK